MRERERGGGGAADVAINTRNQIKSDSDTSVCYM